jgi:Tol biopolymer transport system component
MPPRLSLLLTLAALAVFPAAAQALPAGRTLIASGDATLAAALPAPVGQYTVIDYRGAVSDNGRYVAFTSGSDGLSTDDDDRYGNVYVKDRVTGAVTLASRKTGAAGGPSHGDCFGATISDDGTRVAFACAKSLDAADTNTQLDVYVRDLKASTTTLESRATTGVVVNREATEPMISGDGQAVVFTSRATNLDPADPDDGPDVYWRSLGPSHGTKLVSRPTGLYSAAGDSFSESPSVSDDGTHVAFASRATNLGAFPDTNGHTDIYVRDVVAGETKLASAPDFSGAATGNGDAEESVISGQPNGGQYYVAFATVANNLGSQDTNSRTDVYRRALGNGATVLISRTGGPTPDSIQMGADLGGMSDNGTDVAFTTASSLDPADTVFATAAYVRHTAGGTTELLSRVGDAGKEIGVSVTGLAASGDGKAYAFTTHLGGVTPDSDPEVGSAFVRDLHTSPRRTEHVARPAGTAPFVNQGSDAWLTMNARAISGDGSRVVFRASRGGIHHVHAWVRDMRTGALVLASRADGPDGAPVGDWVKDVTISADGNRVAFVTTSALDPADKDDQPSVYVRDLAASRTFLASRADGADGASASWVGEPALDADGSRVAFVAYTEKLAAGDTDGESDAYVRDLAAGRTLLASGGTDGGASDPKLDAAGTHVAYESTASDIGDGDKDTQTDVHVRDLETGAQRLVSTTPQGVKGDKDSYNPAISDDGTVVAFVSGAPKLLPAGTTKSHVIVRDLARNTLVVADRESGPDGALSGDDVNSYALSGDGTKVAWAAIDGYGLPGPKQVRVRDLVTSTTVIGSRADGAGGATSPASARYPSLSHDGACLAFAAQAPLVAGAGFDYEQVYVRTLGDTCVPPLPQGGGGGGNGADTTAPVLSGVGLSRKRFAIGARATARVASRRRRGTVLRFTSSEAGTLRVKVQRRRNGAFRPKAKLTRTVATGAGRLKFSGRIGRHALRRGRYRFVISVTDAAGNRSQAAKVRFRIVRSS